MSIDTKELLNRLKQAPDIRAFFDEYQNEFLSLRPLDYLTELLRQKDMSLAQVANQSGQGEYVYKVFRGERRPSRQEVYGACSYINRNCTLPLTLEDVAFAAGFKSISTFNRVFKEHKGLSPSEFRALYLGQI